MDYSSFGLSDKVAIVTGASQGIGRAIALGLAEAGAYVVLAKHPGPRMAEIEEEKRLSQLRSASQPVSMAATTKPTM